MPEAEQRPLLSYAPQLTRTRELWSGAILGALGLGLIGLCGCFMIGIGAKYDIFAFGSPPQTVWSNGEYIYVSVLYVCAVLTFTGGGLLMVIGVRTLLRPPAAGQL